MRINFTNNNSIIITLAIGLCFLFHAADSIAQVCPPKSVPYIEDFNTYPGPDLPPCADSLDIDGDGKNWQIENKTSSTGGIHLRFQRERPNGINEGWFFTEGIELEKDTTYTFRCLWITEGRRGTPTLRIHHATDKSVDSMTASAALFDNNGAAQSSFDTIEVDITPTRSGVYYFGFYGYADDVVTQGMNISIDDIVVRKKGAMLKDAGILSIAGLSQDGSFCADNNAEVQIILSNNAILPVHDMLLDFTYTGPTTGARSTTISTPITTGTTDTTIFSGLDFSQTGTYEFVAILHTIGDQVPANDTLRLTVEVLDQQPDADSIIVSSAGNMRFDFDVANPQHVYGYTWDYGDGADGSGRTSAHTFSSPGQYTITLTVENGCGSKTLTHTLTVEDDTDNVSDVIQEETYAIFPNPVKDKLFIRHHSANPLLQYIIYDNQGRLMSRGSVSEQTSIDLSDWPQGLYFFQVQYDNLVQVHKLQILR